MLLKHVAERYGSPVIMVTENGMDREGETGMGLEEALADGARQEFYDGYLRSMVAAVSASGRGGGAGGSLCLVPGRLFTKQTTRYS